MPPIHIIDLQFQGQQKSIAAFLIELPSGPVLVETGPHSCLPELRAGIEQHGFQMEQIKHVFLSHIHLDHAGAAWAFSRHGAKIYVHPAGHRHLLDPSRLMISAKRIYQDKMDELWGDMQAIPKDQLIAIEHEQEVVIDGTAFKAWHTPGHAIHHIAWQMDKQLFAGDVAGVSIEAGVIVPPCPPPDINIEDWENSINLIRTLDIDQIYLTHFGPVGHISSHLDQLSTVLNDWANWMKPYWEQQIDAKEIMPKFTAYVREGLIESGVSEKGLLQYEAANPSWMSVAGLLRYWSKKATKTTL